MEGTFRAINVIVLLNSALSSITLDDDDDDDDAMVSWALELAIINEVKGREY